VGQDINRDGRLTTNIRASAADRKWVKPRRRRNGFLETMFNLRKSTTNPKRGDRFKETTTDEIENCWEALRVGRVPGAARKC